MDSMAQPTDSPLALIKRQYERAHTSLMGEANGMYQKKIHFLINSEHFRNYYIFLSLYNDLHRNRWQGCHKEKYPKMRATKWKQVWIFKYPGRALTEVQKGEIKILRRTEIVKRFFQKPSKLLRNTKTLIETEDRNKWKSVWRIWHLQNILKARWSERISE